MLLIIGSLAHWRSNHGARGSENHRGRTCRQADGCRTVGGTGARCTCRRVCCARSLPMVNGRRWARSWGVRRASRRERSRCPGVTMSGRSRHAVKCRRGSENHRGQTCRQADGCRMVEGTGARCACRRVCCVPGGARSLPMVNGRRWARRSSARSWGVCRASRRGRCARCARGSVNHRGRTSGRHGAVFDVHHVQAFGARCACGSVNHLGRTCRQADGWPMAGRVCARCACRRVCGVADGACSLPAANGERWARRSSARS